MRPTTRFSAFFIISLLTAALWPNQAVAQYYVDSSLRVIVTPRQAEVYVDGYYAGIVDDFDGFFQRLRLPPGDHEVTVYCDGYKTVHQKIYLTPDSTMKLTYTMEKLAAGETQEPRPTAPAQPAQPAYNEPYPPPRMPPARPPAPPASGSPSASEFGALVVRVQPGDADVLIDSERWHAPEGADERLIVQLSEGTHHVEIRKNGFRLFATDVQIRRGETVPLNVGLSPDRE